jgi:hypothetical protein
MLNLWRNIVGKAIDFCVGKLIAPVRVLEIPWLASTNPHTANPSVLEDPFRENCTRPDWLPLRMIRANRFDLLIRVAVL